MTPVALGIHIAQMQPILKSQPDAGQSAGDLAGDEGLAAQGGFMVEQNAIATINTIRLLNLAEQLRSGGLIKTSLFHQAQNTDGLQDAQGTKGIGIGGVLRGFEGDLNMTLGSQIVDLIRLHLLDDPDQVGGIGKIAIMENKTAAMIVGILIEMIDAVGVERRSTTFQAVGLVSLAQ